MEEFVEKALSFTDRCVSEGSAERILVDFAGLVSEFGFDHFIMTGLPAYGEDVEKLIVANGWPAGWTDQYRKGSYFFHDPVSQEAMRTSGKYTWAEARARHPQTRVALQIEDEARDLGMVDGLAFPLFDPENWQAVVSLSSGRKIDLPDRLHNMLYVAAAVCQGRMAELLEPKRRTAPQLAPREREVLSWIAAGKTRSEVGDILGISENTVKTHLASIMRKLGVSNTTHAVARAVYHRQIRL